jgi:hypothetical protein
MNILGVFIIIMALGVIPPLWGPPQDPLPASHEQDTKNQASLSRRRALKTTDPLNDLRKLVRKEALWLKQYLYMPAFDGNPDPERLHGIMVMAYNCCARGSLTTAQLDRILNYCGPKWYGPSIHSQVSPQERQLQQLNLHHAGSILCNALQRKLAQVRYKNAPGKELYRIIIEALCTPIDKLPCTTSDETAHSGKRTCRQCDPSPAKRSCQTEDPTPCVSYYQDERYFGDLGDDIFD